MAGKIAEFGNSPIEDGFAVAQSVQEEIGRIDRFDVTIKKSNLEIGKMLIAGGTLIATSTVNGVHPDMGIIGTIALEEMLRHGINIPLTHLKYKISEEKRSKSKS